MNGLRVILKSSKIVEDKREFSTLSVRDYFELNDEDIGYMDIITSFTSVIPIHNYRHTKCKLKEFRKMMEESIHQNLPDPDTIITLDDPSIDLTEKDCLLYAEHLLVDFVYEEKRLRKMKKKKNG